jgi:hypothetical protein
VFLAATSVILNSYFYLQGARQVSNINFGMSMAELRAEIVKFNNDITAQRLRSYYYEKTYPEILGVSRREISHSSFLAWILNPVESHGIGDFSLRRLIEILMTSKFWPKKLPNSELFDDFITGNFELTKSSVQREVSIESAGRVDVLIELFFNAAGHQFPLRVVLENKVLSIEGNDQTKRYYKHFMSLNDKSANLFVYLTPLSTLDLEELDEQECEDKHFIQINYQELVDSLLEPVLEQTISSETRFIISHYIQSLSQPSMDDQGNDYERGMIMAIGKEERELLQKFWMGNQKIIQAALYAISSDPNQEKDVRDTVREALSSIATTGKDRRTILIRYDGVDHHTRIQKSDIGLETVRLLDSKGLIDDSVFSWLSKDTSCSFKLLKKKEEVRDNEAKYGRYRIKQAPEFLYKNQEYYVARNWGIGNIDKFISKMKSRFPKLEFVV